MRLRKKIGERKNICSKCGSELDRPNQRYCKYCHAEYMRLSRVIKKILTNGNT